MSDIGGQGAQGKRRGKGEQISPAVRRAFAYLIILALAIGAASLLSTAFQVNAAQHKWCTTMTLLTARPVPRPANPAANPSREQSYVFYADFRQLRRELGCG